MSLSIHVNGEAKARTGTASASALEDLGVTVDGAEIELRDYTEPVFTDTFGPDVPFDEQQFLEDALIRLTLVFYDDAVLAKVRGRSANIATTAVGTTGFAGALWGSGVTGQGGAATKMYFRLLILSPGDALPYNFLNSRLRNSASQKIGTRRTLWTTEFIALPYTGTGGTTSGNVLYNRTTTG